MTEAPKKQTLERLGLYQTFQELIPGTKVDLQFFDASRLRVKAKLIGYEPSRYIILKIPYNYIRDYSNVVAEKNDCIVRTIVENDKGLCVAFRSTLLAIITRVKGLIFISFPNKIESITLRKEQRVATHLPITISYLQDDLDDDDLDVAAPQEKLKGHIVDISPGGCRASISWDREISEIKLENVLVQIRTKETKEPIEIKATIRNKSRENQSKVTLGMAFVATDKLDTLLNELKI